MNTGTEQRQTIEDVMDPARAAAWAVALGLDDIPGFGDPLPPFFHQLYFWDPQPPAALGRDGHPATGELTRDMGLPRRMWAAGKCVWHQSLIAGIKASRSSQIESVTRKDGRSGPLAFVRIRHDVKQRHQLVLTEWQELVYRSDPVEGAPVPEAPMARSDEARLENVDFDSTLLFRYSALTMNGHRIHYDSPYARRVEGYEGLVVHGPLLAQMLMLMAMRERGALNSFSFRLTAPLILKERAVLCLKGDTGWVRAADGRQCLIADIS